MRYSKTDFFAMLPRTPLEGPVVECLNSDQPDLHWGEKTDQPKPMLKYKMYAEKTSKKKIATPLDLHDAGNGHLLFSSKMMSCLKRCGINNIQFFDCDVKNMITDEKLSYQLGNIVGVVEALDRKKAECEIDEDGMVETFDTLVINKKKTKGYKLFRMYESLHLIFVSGEVREALEKDGVTGIMWMGEDDWEAGTAG